MVTEIWMEEAAHTWCPNSLAMRIGYQLSCQALCEAESRFECVGISFSQGYDYCYLCRDDTTESTRGGYGFYRRLGISEILL